jgi:hypothetical protein
VKAVATVAEDSTSISIGDADSDRSKGKSAEGGWGRKEGGRGGRLAEGAWKWGDELHGTGDLVQLPMLAVITGDTEPRKHWTFHDAYCGIGNVRAGLELAGGECTGAFDRC